jgi:hypothetical protein
MKRIFTLILLAVATFALSDQFATTEDGRKVLLLDDGTWEYQETSTAAPLSLVGWAVNKQKADIENHRFNDYVILVLTVRNETALPVKGWRLIVEAHNAFGDMLGQLQLTGGTSKIEVGGTTVGFFIFEDNPFINGEPYDYLTAYDKDTMSLEVTEARAVQ